MHIAWGYQLTTLILFGAGIILMGNGFFSGKGLLPVRVRDGPKYRLRKMTLVLLDKRQDPLFSSAGIGLNMDKYKLLRKLITGTLLFFSTVYLIDGQLILTRKLLIVALLMYYLSYPKTEIHGRKTLFSRVLSRMQARRSILMEEELTGIIMQMQNIILSRNNRQISANYLLTQLLPFTKLTRKAFTATLRYIRQGEVEQAAAYFKRSLDTQLGSQFADILAKLDELPAWEFQEQLDILREKAEAGRRGRKNKKMIRINLIRHGFAMVEGFIIVGNFLYLIIIDSMKILAQLK